MSDVDYRSVIAEVVQKLPDLLRADHRLGAALAEHRQHPLVHRAELARRVEAHAGRVTRDVFARALEWLEREVEGLVHERGRLAFRFHVDGDKRKVSGLEDGSIGKVQGVMADKAELSVADYSDLASGTKIFTVDEALAAFQPGTDSTSLQYMAKQINPFLVKSGLTKKQASLKGLFAPQFTEAYLTAHSSTTTTAPSS